MVIIMVKWSRLFRYLTLQVEVTGACNLDCKICMRPNLERPIRTLSLNNFKRILDSGNFRYVGLHGWGEPLLTHHLFEMISYAELKGISTNLTTNGTLVKENVDNILNSSLREIAFGVYDRDRFQSRSLSPINELLEEKKRRNLETPKSYLDITIYQGNLNQIEELVKLAPELHIDAVILHRLFNVYKVDPALKYISMQEEEELFTKVRSLANELKLELYLPPKHSSPCRMVKNCIFVTSQGEVTPCCFLPEYVFGNALEQGVEEIMNSKTFLDFIKNMKKHPVCSKCQW
jgi:MoaA/NifB/PqqE/SkfB family radical SAM enzyme